MVNLSNVTVIGDLVIKIKTYTDKDKVLLTAPLVGLLWAIFGIFGAAIAVILVATLVWLFARFVVKSGAVQHPREEHSNGLKSYVTACAINSAVGALAWTLEIVVLSPESKGLVHARRTLAGRDLPVDLNAQPAAGAEAGQEFEGDAEMATRDLGTDLGSSHGSAALSRLDVRLNVMDASFVVHPRDEDGVQVDVGAAACETKEFEKDCSVWLPEGRYHVAFEAVPDFTTPADVNVVLEQGDVREVEGCYADPRGGHSGYLRVEVEGSAQAVAIVSAHSKLVGYHPRCTACTFRLPLGAYAVYLATRQTMPKYRSAVLQLDEEACWSDEAITIQSAAFTSARAEEPGRFADRIPRSFFEPSSRDSKPPAILECSVWGAESKWSAGVKHHVSKPTGQQHGLAIKTCKRELDACCQSSDETGHHFCWAGLFVEGEAEERYGTVWTSECQDPAP